MGKLSPAQKDLDINGNDEIDPFDLAALRNKHRAKKGIKPSFVKGKKPKFSEWLNEKHPEIIDEAWYNPADWFTDRATKIGKKRALTNLKNLRSNELEKNVKYARELVGTRKLALETDTLLQNAIDKLSEATNIVEKVHASAERAINRSKIELRNVMQECVELVYSAEEKSEMPMALQTEQALAKLFSQLKNTQKIYGQEVIDGLKKNMVEVQTSHVNKIQYILDKVKDKMYNALVHSALQTKTGIGVPFAVKPVKFDKLKGSSSIHNRPVELPPVQLEPDEKKS